MSLRWLWGFSFVVAGAVAGCDLGSGVGSLGGTLFIRGCSQSNDYGSLAMPAGYSMNPTFFAANMVDSPPYQRQLHPINSLAIRMQGQGAQPNNADVLYVNIADDAQVAAALNQPLPLGPATNVRATLNLNLTCRYAESEPALDGTITFSAFGSATGGGVVPNDFLINFGDRLAATLDVTVVDQRTVALGGVGPVSTAPAVAGHLTGSFDFIVRPGKIAQPF